MVYGVLRASKTTLPFPVMLLYFKSLPATCHFNSLMPILLVALNFKDSQRVLENIKMYLHAC